MEDRAELPFVGATCTGAAACLLGVIERDTLGWRNLDLQDDMANWGNRKYTLGEVDVFQVHRGYELYGTMNINYIELDALPRYRDGWQSVLDSLRAGSFFVTTGEVLIPGCTFGGKKSGETLAATDLESVPLRVQLEWTYPLSHLEVVSGDGETVHRHRIDLSDTAEFGSKTIEQSLDLSGRRWARIEVWDIARNGAFTQPVWME